MFEKPLDTPRAYVAAALLLLLSAAAFRPVFVKIYSYDRAALHRIFSADADKGVEQYPEFLEEIAKRTRPGDSVAILVPMRDWDEGYAYAYYRASFILAGRKVLPLVWRDNSVRRENFSRADYVAAWQMSDEAIAMEPVWTGNGGALYRRVR